MRPILGPSGLPEQLQVAVAAQVVFSGVLTRLTRRLGQRPVTQERVLQHRYGVGEVKLPVVVGVHSVRARGLNPALEHVSQPEDGVGDVSHTVHVGVATFERQVGI